MKRMTQDISQQSVDREPTELVYEPPDVRDLGSLSELTLSGPGVGSDGLNGSSGEGGS
jgi:hypothetical protein